MFIMTKGNRISFPWSLSEVTYRPEDYLTNDGCLVRDVAADSH